MQHLPGSEINNTVVQVNLSYMKKEAACWSGVKQHCARDAGQPGDLEAAGQCC